jgi:uncharacterized protein (DUF1800 family)
MIVSRTRSTACRFAALLAIGAFAASAPVHAQLKTDWTEDDIRHLVRRTTFGPTPEIYEFIAKKGVPAYLDSILGKDGENKPPKVRRSYERRARKAEVDDKKFPEQRELARWWLHIMVESKSQFPEVMALFWHNHFATSQEVLGPESREWMFDHVNLMRHHGLGNLRELLYEVSIDWVMLEWLNGLQSRVGAPNENFAREFWELFTLGADNGYTQEDIEEAARCFTGFRKRTHPKKGYSWVEFDETRHDSGDKTIFGLTVAGRSGREAYEEYRDVVDLTLENRQVAEFMVRKLFEFFCFTSPEQATVDELAALLRDSDYEISPLVRRILLMEEFYSPEATAGFVKNPVEFAVGFVRSTKLEMPTDVLESRLEDSGQRVTMPPGVNGWPSGLLWLSSQAMVERANCVRESIYRRDYQLEEKIDIEDVLPEEDQRSAGQMVAHLADLLNVSLSSEETQVLVDYLDSDMNNLDQVISDPFDGTDPIQIDKKVRGLLYILGQHPTFHLR